MVHILRVLYLVGILLALPISIYAMVDITKDFAHRIIAAVFFLPFALLFALGWPIPLGMGMLWAFLDFIVGS